MTLLGSPTAAASYRTLLSDIDSSSNIFVGGLREQSTEAFINALDMFDDPPAVRFLTNGSVLKWMRRDFHVASLAADLTASDTLVLRDTEDDIENTLLVTDDSAIPLIAGDGQTVTPETDSEYVEAIQQHCSNAWEKHTEFNLRTPPRSRVYETLAEQLSDDMQSDYQTMLEEIGSTRSGRGETQDGDNLLNEVGLALLSGARQTELLYDLSNWGDRISLASRATFSRLKSKLEEHDFLETEKVPIEVGRPRQRLLLAERLHKFDADELPYAVRDELENSSD
ncbi:transcriptional regulator TbsP domain-containing protein [Halococcus thailandensis]|uniref:Transcriptional regulator n=1 Tax=Halococcus thailandensis JCM 13552 TaxID=1227457 RepID=M0NE14_9EURY|nr:DUF5821 family protein [Halococcus thailandensis]EMA55803.1 hypothetical protein C451_04968 [Halococcus thailandensis JCM 13552]